MVDDAFARLGLERKALLEPDEVRRAFQKAAAATHPDTAGADGPEAEDKDARTAEFRLVNEASARLTPVASRLRHLLELEFPEFAPARSTVMDEALVTLFTRAGAAVQGAAEWLKKRQAADTFLAKAALAAAGLEVRENLEAAGALLTGAQEEMRKTLEELDLARQGGRADPGILHGLAQRAAFLEKWQAQIRSSFASLFAEG